MRKVQVTRYVSCDGFEFDEEDDCIAYESKIFEDWFINEMMNPEAFLESIPLDKRPLVKQLMREYFEHCHDI